MDEAVPEFSNVEAECAFWKSKARELKTDLDEFTEDSHQLEKELEITIKLKDDQLTDLRHKYNRQQHDNDNLVGKLKQSENESLQWEQRYKKEKSDAEVLRKHCRELEQKNDDLERAHRIVSESVTEFERMLNREYEKNVMLEVEYEMEKENAQIQLQRLMDEARDLKQELKIQQKQPGSQHKLFEEDEEKHDKDDGKDSDAMIDQQSEFSAEQRKRILERRDSRKMDTDESPQQLMNGGSTPMQQNGHPESVPVSCQTTPQLRSSAATMQRENSLKQMDRLKNGGSMTASSRSTALAIVADLLRRVNECLQLDTKLVCGQCKTLQCECPSRINRRQLPVTENNNQLPEDTRASLGLSSRIPGVAEKSGMGELNSNEDRPAAIRLASILGLRRIDLDTSSGGGAGLGSLKTKSTNAPVIQQDNATSSPSSWFKDKFDKMTTNKFLSNKNIDATLKELKRPKSIDDDLGETNDTRDDSGGTIHTQTEPKAKSPSLIC